MQRLFLVALIATSTCGCTFTRAVNAWSAPKTIFYACTNEPRILCEPGSESLAQAAAPLVAQSIQRVEQNQYVPFPKDIIIYTYASRENYARHSATSIKSSASAGIGAVHLSPKLLEKLQRLPLVLPHELSHLHIQQHVGGGLAQFGIPGWFMEGLAVVVSDGGGAEKVSPEEARTAFQAGRHFQPVARRSLLAPESAATYGLEAHLYYRQSSMFVSYLRDQNLAAFAGLMKSINARIAFANAIQSNYGQSLQTLWQDFLDSLSLHPTFDTGKASL